MKCKNRSVQLSLTIIENKKSKYKDQCDICKKFDYCRGFGNKVLCAECKSKSS